MNLVLAAAECKDLPKNCFEIPSPPNPLFEFKPFLLKNSEFFAINRTAMLYLLSAVIIITVMLVAFNKPKLIPGKFQSALEAIVGFIRDDVVIPAAGQGAVRYLPLLTSIFFFVWINSLYEVLPLVNFPTTSRMAVPMMLALLVWTTFILVGIKSQGLKYFTNVMFPPGVPKILYILIAPIEFVSTFLVRPLTLAVRLFANMVAGHILLTVCFTAANAFLIGFGPSLQNFEIIGNNALAIPIGLIGLLGGAALVGFEILVGSLQAYIFTMLAAVYIGSSMSADH